MGARALPVPMPTLDRPTYLEGLVDPLFAGPGEMRAHCRAFEWTATPLGPPARWPTSLRSVVGIVLASPVPMWIGWGPDHRQLFNDACLALGERFPVALGRPAAESGIECGTLDAALAGGAPVVGSPALSCRCSPIPDPDAPDGVGGVLAIVETTLGEARYRTVFDAIDEAFAILEVIVDGDRAVDLRYLEANPAAVRMSRQDHLVGRRLLDFAPGIEPYWLELFGRVATTGVGERHELPASPSGRTYDVFLFKVGAPHEMHVASIAHDVSERARRERQETLLTEIALELVGLTDIEPTLTRLGERIGRFFGVTWCRFDEVADDAAVVTYGWSDAGAPPLRALHELHDFRADEQPAAVHDVRADSRFDAARFEAHGVRAFVLVPLVRDGRTRFRISIVADAPRRWCDAEVALLREIAERIWLRLEHARVEEALRASEERFRTMTDVVPDLLWESEPDGTTPWYNARWYEYTGQTPAEARRTRWLDAVHPDDRARSAARDAHGTERGGTLVQELRIRRHDGAYRWFLVRSEPLHDAGGCVVRWLGAATDVHAQRTALEEVECLIAERTSERDTLRRQLAGAEEAERRRLARELHDQLGQQLTAVSLGTSDALRLATTHDGAHAAPDAPLVRRLAGLQALAREMQSTTRYLALELRPPELDDVGLESALETYVRQWSARYGVAAEVAATGLADHPLPTEVGSTLYRIAQEALTNVAKHAAATQVSVIVERRDAGVQLVVEDDGRGFDVEQIARRARTERRFGLAGIQERAMLVGGSVTLESSPGQGTTLFVRLPAGEPATPSPLSAP